MRSPVTTVLRTGDSTARIFSSARVPISASVPTFVLVHGVGMSHRYFRRLQRELSRVGHVHAIDLPGFGRNRRPRRQKSVEESAAVLVAAIEALGIESCVLIGHSMGTQFIIEASILRPDLATHIVLIAPVADPRRPMILRHALAMMVDSALETPAINTIEFTDSLRSGPLWYLDQALRMLAYPIQERIPLVTRPVLVVRGARDPVARKRWCTALAAGASDGRSVSIPRGAHIVQYSRSAALRRQIVAFIEATVPTGARPS